MMNQTKKISVRVDPDEYKALKEKARALGISISDLVRERLELDRMVVAYRGYLKAKLATVKEERRALHKQARFNSRI